MSTEIVLAVITHGEHICLMRRSAQVRGDNGKWHCITGFLDENQTPLSQAYAEIREEAGLGSDTIELKNTLVLEHLDGNGCSWRIHAFHFESDTRDICLNWENDASLWACSQHFSTLPTVSWLRNVLGALSDTLPEYAGPETSYDKEKVFASAPAITSLSDFAYAPPNAPTANKAHLRRREERRRCPA
ncbi:NUDIX domain-containing protein [Hydrocarboniphaga sp.]|uniref:NUDIX domain-containing protein n=1 Tax=Hydrocarboniphaga sp. TaxID=2033016 RepID=UPI002634DC08|nr:NUDIX domain-containing protein [Hydrocarboniphaga sp.]